MSYRMKTWPSFWKQHHTWIGAAITGLLVMGCYGFALRLPFFFDDLPIMTWLKNHTWADIWLSSENAYYRPLAFTIFKLGCLFPQGVRQIVLHSVNLLFHWASAVLVMQVVKLCGRDAKQALLASALFVLFPFIYLAVPWVTALCHLAVVLLTLLAVYAALRAEHDDTIGWWALSLSATALTLFAHESGVVCCAIVGGILLVQRGFWKRPRCASLASSSAECSKLESFSCAAASPAWVG